jgi:hypothetical protein
MSLITPLKWYTVTVEKRNRVAPCCFGCRRTLNFIWATSLDDKLRGVLVHLIQG